MSRTNDETAFPTESSEWAIGGRVRQPLAGINLLFEADVGSQRFKIGDSYAMEKPDIPSVRYRYLRGGASTTFPVAGGMSVGIRAGYRYVMSAGEIEQDEFFPRLSVGGVDGALWLAYDLGAHWQVYLGADIERYFYSMNPEPGDPLVAGGAIDQFIGGRFGLAYRL
jgi:hypothetical protein